MDTRPAAALGLSVGGAVGAGATRLADDLTLSLALGLVVAVAVGVAARWEPVARRRGVWEGVDGRSGSLVAGGVTAVALVAAVVGVHPALELDAETTLLLRLLVVGCVFAGLYLGVAAVLLGVDLADDAGAPGDRDDQPVPRDDAGTTATADERD